MSMSNRPLPSPLQLVLASKRRPLPLNRFRDLQMGLFCNYYMLGSGKKNTFANDASTHAVN